MISFSPNISLIFKSLVPYRGQVLLSLIFILFHTILGFSLIFLTSRFHLSQLPIFLILLFSLHHLLSVFDDWILTGISQHWMMSTRRKCLRRFLEISEKSKSNSLIDWNELQMEIHWLGDSIFSLLRSTLRKIFQIFAFSIALIWLSPILFLFCGILFFFVFFLGFFFGRQINRLQEKVITEESACSIFEFEAARAMPLIRSFQQASLFSKIHSRFLHPFTEGNIRLARLRMIFHPIQIILFLITIVLVYSIGSMLVRQHNLSQSAFFSFLAGLSLLHAPLSGLSQDISLFLGTRYMKFLPVILEDSITEEPAIPNTPISNIELDDVSFSYSGSTNPLLQNVSLRLSTGTITGIQGANGSGKTTLALLLCGVLKPDSGKILIDGSLGVRIPVGYVDQNGTVFSLSLPENLFLDENETDSAVLGSTRFLKFMSPEQSKQRLSPEILSAGQRKSISIERAFRVNTQILIIDEPENALDESAREFFRQQILGKKLENNIIVLFSHSESFLSICDQRLQIADLSKGLYS